MTDLENICSGIFEITFSLKNLYREVRFVLLEINEQVARIYSNI